MLCSYFYFQALTLLSHPFICRKHPEIESQIKKHFLFSVELLVRLVSGIVYHLRLELSSSCKTSTFTLLKSKVLFKTVLHGLQYTTFGVLQCMIVYHSLVGSQFVLICIKMPRRNKIQMSCQQGGKTAS